MTNQSGFSLVELIMVMLLIAILAVGGFALFANKSDFSARAARDSLVAIAALAQQRALVVVGDSSSDAVTLNINQTADQWVVSLEQSVNFNGSNIGGDPLQVIHIDRHGSQLTANGSNLANGATKTLRYNRQGRLITKQNFVISSATDSKNFCVSETGFPYPQACQL